MGSDYQLKWELKLQSSELEKNEDVNPLFDGCTADHRWNNVSIVSPESVLWSGLIVNQNWFWWFDKRINMYEVLKVVCANKPRLEWYVGLKKNYD